MNLFNWLLFLDVADHLISFGTEASYRSATSRVYYGVFGEIRHRLENQGIRFRHTNIHSQVIGWLRDQPQSGLKQIGLNLGRLRRERNFADYDAMHKFTQQRAKKSLLQAQMIQSTIPFFLS